MGRVGGLAGQIARKYPENYKQYIEYCNQFKPNLRALLGDVLYIKTNDGKIIANLFGQYNTGINKRQTDYNALNETFNKLRGYIIGRA